MSLLFNGDFANPDEPLWLRYLAPGQPPANLQVSTVTVNQSGGIVMNNNNNAYPTNDGSQISFNRAAGSPLAPSALEMRSARAVGVPFNDSILSVTTNGGTVYDDIALKGIQVFGNQVTNPTANAGAAGYITGARAGHPPFSMRINTGYIDVDRLSSFIINADIVEVNDDLTANRAVFSTLTVSSSAGSIGNNIVVSTIQAQSGAISTFNALTVAAPIINSQTINTSTINISSFTLPNSLAVSSINACTINASGIVASTLNVSSFVLPQAFTVSSLNASTVNTSLFTTSTLSVSSFTLPNTITFSTINSSTLNANLGTFSTLAISSFTLPNALTVSSIAASSINSGNISTNVMNVGTLNSLVGNFSTLNAPGGTTTPIVSSVITVAKELFTSTMTFSATLSPNLDLGLGGVIGGLVGGVTANAMGVGLGAAGLATGMSALILARTSGGLNPSQFQTVNGTTQLQFSTIMAANPGIALTGKFLETDSASPLTTPGNLSTVTKFLGFGQSFVARSVSDPLNLPNADGAAGKAIQSFGEWTKVLPGAMDMGISSIFNQYNTAYIDFDYTSFVSPSRAAKITIGNTLFPEGSFITEIKGNLEATNIVSALGVDCEAVEAQLALFSSINAVNNMPPYNVLSTLSITPGIATSTINVSGLTVSNSISTNSISTNTLAAFNANVGNVLTVLNNVNVTNNVTANNVNLTSINGVPYNPITAGMPSGALMMWPGGSGLTGPTNVPVGYLYCDGSTYSVGAPYVALYAAIGNSWGGTPGVSFRVPDCRGRAAFGSVVDSSSGGGFAYSPQVTFQSVTVSGVSVNPDTNNGWYVTATTAQVYVGMQFNFAGATGVRTITKILSNNGIGDGWVTPFVIVWNNSGVSNAFPVFVSDSVAVLQTESTTTIAPFIGRQPTDPGATYNLQAAMGTPGNGQAIDQTSAHNHSYGLGGAGSPQLVGGNRSGDPTNSYTTGNTNGLYSYVVPGGSGVTVNNIMLTNPPNFGVFYFIKI
jgi:microcystin-dependent protein